MATYWVRADGGGSDANDGLSYANAFATIAHAFDQVSQGDTLRLVNDGDHTATNSAGALTVQSLFNGTDYNTDPGLIIEGVDASGDPAVATVKATNDTNSYFLDNLSSAADYIWIRGIRFDWSYFVTNVGTLRDLISDGSTVPPHFKFSSCMFDFGDFGQTMSQDTAWGVFDSVNASGNQSATAPGTWEIEYCFFKNAHAGFLNVGGINTTYHHNIFHIDADQYSTASYIVNGGAFYKDTREIRFYNNTVIWQFYDTDDPGNILTCANTGTDDQYFYNNVYYLDSGPGGSGDIDNTILVGASAADQEAAGQMGYNVFAWGPRINSPLAFSNGGYYSYQFSEDWRAGSTTNTQTALATNDVQTFTGGLTGIFNAAGTWTWSTTEGYSMDVPYDYRITFGRDAGLGGAVPGAVTEVINNPPVISGALGVTIGETLSVTQGQTLSVTAGDGVASVCSDDDGDTLTYNVLDSVTHGTLTFNTTTGAFEYTADATYAGTDMFTFEACDGTTCTSLIVDTATTAYALIEVTPLPVVDSTVTTPAFTNLIDTAPFFRPTLEVTTEMRLRTKKNRKPHHDLANYTEKVLWDESLHRVINLGTNTTTQITLGGVATGEYLFVETDNDINVSINGDGNYWPVSEMVAVALTSVTSLYLQNESSSDTAQVILAVAD